MTVAFDVVGKTMDTCATKQVGGQWDRPDRRANGRMIPRHIHAKIPHEIWKQPSINTDLHF